MFCHERETIQDWICMSKYAGMREDLVQAGGGNSSYKISDCEMIIKASGYQLADVTGDDGYAVVNPKIIRDLFENNKNVLSISEEEIIDAMSCAFISGKRASIETFLHAISGRYTLHTHPVLANVLLARDDDMCELKKIFPNALFVPYAKPGVDLAKAYFNEYKKKSQNSNITFLQNHGIVVSGNTADEVIQTTEGVIDEMSNYLGVDNSANRATTSIWKYFPNQIVWRVTDINVIEVFRGSGEWNHQFCPDCIVFLGKKFINRSGLEKLKIFSEENGEPVVVVDSDNLYIVAESVKKALEIQSVLSFSAQVMKLNWNYNSKLLTDEQQNELINWEAEKYRKAIKSN